MPQKHYKNLSFVQIKNYNYTLDESQLGKKNKKKLMSFIDTANRQNFSSSEGI
jgi:hypothetical protein